MAFVNEYISKEDIKKYDIFRIRNKFLSGSFKIENIEKRVAWKELNIYW